MIAISAKQMTPVRAGRMLRSFFVFASFLFIIPTFPGVTPPFHYSIDTGQTKGNVRNFSTLC